MPCLHPGHNPNRLQLLVGEGAIINFRLHPGHNPNGLQQHLSEQTTFNLLGIQFTSWSQPHWIATNKPTSVTKCLHPGHNPNRLQL